MDILEIIYEDEDIIAINKPAGLIVHPDGKTEEPSVSEWFVKKYPESKNIGETFHLSSGKEVERSGVVHRIDRDTSGVLLLAKTDIGFQTLKQQFQNREIEKFYNAFVYGLVKNDRGTINLPISKSKSDFRKWMALTPSRLVPFRKRKNQGRGELREALTYFEILKRDENDKVTLVEAKPKTGRTHQIRVHFKALHHPILGDKLYGSSITQNLSKTWGFNRLALHARRIIFKNTQGEKIDILASYPTDFKQALKKIDFKP